MKVYIVTYNSPLDANDDRNVIDKAFTTREKARHYIISEEYEDEYKESKLFITEWCENENWQFCEHISLSRTHYEDGYFYEITEMEVEE